MEYSINFEELLNRLKEYNWQGNIRELQNVLQRLTILLAEGPLDYVKVLNTLHSPTVTRHDDFLHGKNRGKNGIKGNELAIREKIQRDLMIEALQKSRGNVTAAAKLMDIQKYILQAAP